MFLMQKNSERLVEVLSLTDLFNPNHSEIVGRFHAGEEMQDAEKFIKAQMQFPSGEPLPQCWLDAGYRHH
ncbi:MAG: acetyltransferase [gamma proteobacterium symbiont of Stewartia floridana]|uniref:Acetyltransferase n=1 Tax=Candidatus Thiodiazotropha taylori TaxID=2792791 RepID=A0A9E4N425_9GAMM|nr:acetyltransferase [Candidatus Thiodiazotropha taylori]MCG7962013.1 acetyltransferase [Candidatus Thiodiazotropha endolucinida]RLW54590.1 MAG: acetyltransferase [gamma proteobacterium symbiont of Stewartia floridana]MCG7892939.1 acetyltransferase [Candidatus Thiodiazotropha taylori]MCG7905771.1 acetyltransferase [Candidatus Thiodiazotropha taylori]